MWNIAEYEGCVRYEQLIRDDGIIVGSIMRFYEDGPTYALGQARRLGAFSSDAAAREAVEQQRLAFGGPGSALPQPR